ncbi:hypothetical protein PG999_007795 [Apiospora kogelbergensis]|uniref:Rhodopsin domain-containing protein n=1 Tax=Apiospora kogelbergensis TaxID=1337665 RepID=A0AAW0QRC7_9PEZI
MYNDTAAREGFAAALLAMSHTQDLSETLCHQTRVLVIVITLLATVFVALRFLGRWRQGVSFGADDWTCLVALVLLYANFIIHLILIDMGVGMHIGAMSVDHIESLSKVLFTGEILYVTSINIYKISLLFFYWRTFPVRLMKIGGIVLGIFTLLWTLSAIFVIVIQCLPVSKVWQPWAEGTCTNLLHTEPAMAGLNIFCDVAILCLPLKPVLGLRINAAQKAFVIGTFLLGSYVVFTSCYRLAMFFKFDPTDATYTLAEAQAWDVVEMASGIISCCLPTLGPILKTMTNSIITNTRLSTRMSAFGPAAVRARGPKQDLDLVTIGGSGGSSTCKSPRSPHWSNKLHHHHDNKYGVIDDDMYNDDGMVVEKKSPSPQPFVQREVAMLMRNGASAPIIQSQDDETPLRPAQMGDAV